MKRTWPSDWEARRSGMGCPACSEGRPDRIPDGERFFAGATSDAYLNRDTRSRGYALLFWRGRHVAELSDLDPGELASFTSELVRVCRAIETHYQPAKLNLMVLGNSLPHLHAHIVPRFVDDASPGRPPRFMMVDQDWPPIGDEDYQRQLEALRDSLAPSLPIR
jgi:diadenosine tetraphosphate (Ap4A) HIT family hydrolase